MRLIPSNAQKMNMSFLHNANSLTEVRNDTKEFDNSNMSFESQESQK